MTQHSMERKSFEFIKNMPYNIQFDWDALDADYDFAQDSNQYKQIRAYIENDLMPKIHNLSYFSLAKFVKPKYRQYIKDYLTISDDAVDVISAIQTGKVLIVDDINTTGSTLKEIIRLIRNINNDCEIYIFTLIGKP